MFIIIVITNHRRKKKFLKFADERFFTHFFQKFSVFHWSLKHIIYTLSFIFLIIALARPQWNKEVQIAKKRGIDIAICLDVSKSMKAEDIKPNRLKRAKDQISLFIDQLKGDRVALIAFAGRSYVQCPLTDDYGAIKLFLDLMDTESVTSYGTNIGAAINKAMSLFKQSNKHKVIIIVSDGEDLEKNAKKVANEAAKNGAIIYTLGIGSPEGATIPIINEDGDKVYAKDSKGNIILTKLDITTLTQIAQHGNGKFYPITPQQSEIFEILKNINLIEKNRYESQEYVRYEEQYKYFVLLSLFLIFLENLITYRKKGKIKRIIEE